MNDLARVRSYAEVRRRLFCPPSAREDKGIDLSRPTGVKGTDGRLVLVPKPIPKVRPKAPAKVDVKPVVSPPPIEVVIPRPTVSTIVREVCSVFGVRENEVMSKRRTANVVLPRQIAMALACRLTIRSLPEIGRSLGGRDHTTVLHAKRKLAKQVQAAETIVTEADSPWLWAVAVKNAISILPPDPYWKCRRARGSDT